MTAALVLGVLLAVCDAPCPRGTRREAEGAQVRCVDRDGKLEGPFCLYHPGGALFLAARYAAGRLEGLARKWYPDGTPMARGAFAGNAKEGPWVFYHPNGRVARAGTFRAGRRVGTWRCYTADGVEDPDACR